MYGGGHYIISAAADLTPQGRAILEASKKFGDGKIDRGNHVISSNLLFPKDVLLSYLSFTSLLGKTLCFPPCKRYYNPHSPEGERLYACNAHSSLRMKRLKKEGWKWRAGEKQLDQFWKNETLVPARSDEAKTPPSKKVKQDKRK